MNQSPAQPSFELPAPVTSDDAQGGEVYQKLPATPEKNIQHTPPQSDSQQSTAPAAVSPIPVQPFMPPSPVSQQTAAPIAPLTADDADLIEKEWVTKAKQIVAATKENPYMQNKELHKFKAEYLKKRYNKDIKVDES